MVSIVGPYSVPAVAAALVALRDGYERIFVGLIAALPPHTPLTTLRLMRLGALNWTPSWYRADGGHSPRKLASVTCMLKALLQP